MLKRLFLPFLALLGALVGLALVLWNLQEKPVPPLLYPPPTSPYPSAIAAAGVIECSSLDISIGTPYTELLKEVYVCEGMRVKKYDPLFRLDCRVFQTKAAAAQAEVELATVLYEDKKRQFSFYERLRDKSAVSEQAYQSAYFAMEEAKKQIDVAKSALAEAQLGIERSTVCAPMDALILQVNARPGETAATVPLLSRESILVILGTVSPLHVRIDIDADDVWRYQKGAQATAFLRGNSKIHFPLQFVRIDPYIIPKTTYTGDLTEKLDTRVLQVIYSFEWGDLPIYPGQVLDVFIEAPSR